VASTWRVVAEPEGNNPGLLDKAKAALSNQEGNTGGMIIYVTNGTLKEEVSRVGFVRRNTKNPKTSFENQLRKELDKARTAATSINDLLDGSGDLQ
jgi:hypothetical protein